MKKLPAISDAEWEVMNAVWADSPVSSAEVVERLSRAMDWNHRTIKTMLNRLVKKGALLFETEGKKYLYRPAVKREECVRSESRSFLSRFFGGTVGPMLVQFVSQADLSAAEIEELKRVLAKKTK